MSSVVRRDDKVFTFYFYDENGYAIDLTGCTIFTTVKQNQEDLDASAKISGTLSITAPATGGIATWTLVPADTQYLLGQYFWDVQLKSVDGKITTLIRDIFEVLPDTTIRIA